MKSLSVLLLSAVMALPATSNADEKPAEKNNADANVEVITLPGNGGGIVIQSRSEDGNTATNSSVKTSGRVVMVGPDGVRREFVIGPNEDAAGDEAGKANDEGVEAGGVEWRVITIDENGKQTTKVMKGKALELPAEMKLPADANDRVKEIMKRMEMQRKQMEKMRGKLPGFPELPGVEMIEIAPARIDQMNRRGSIEKKLDSIIERLEAIEKRLDAQDQADEK